jgi:hypothetical protein
MDGGYGIFYGSTTRDGNSGFQFPSRFAMRQRGVIIDSRWDRYSRDRPDSY